MEHTRPSVSTRADASAIEAQAGGVEQSRSNYGTVPGAELPVAVYVSVFVAFAWIVVASLIAFANGADADLALGMAVVLTVVFFALPLLVWLTAKSHARSAEEAGDFLSSPVETATGTLTGAHSGGTRAGCYVDRRHLNAGSLRRTDRT